MICSAASETSALLDTCITERLIGSDISIQMDKIIAKSRVASNFNLVLKFNKSLSYSINSKEQTEESGTEPGQRWTSAVEKDHHSLELNCLRIYQRVMHLLEE